MAITTDTVRHPNVAGTFYEADPKRLQEQLSLFFKYKKKPPDELRNKYIHAVISPHAGYNFCGMVMASVYQLLSDSEIHRIILIGPSHTKGFQSLAIDTVKSWKSPLGMVPVDMIAYEYLQDHIEFKSLPDVFEKEHSLEVQIPFIQKVLSQYTLIPLCTGQDLPHKKIADAISPLISDSTLVIVSSDFSHYHPEHPARILDQKSISAILSKDSLQINKDVDACGVEGIKILNDLAILHKWTPVLVDYQTSGDITGDTHAVVGYAGIAYV